MEINDTPPCAALHRILELLDYLGVAERADNRPDALSMGRPVEHRFQPGLRRFDVTTLCRLHTLCLRLHRTRIHVQRIHGNNQL